MKVTVGNYSVAAQNTTNTKSPGNDPGVFCVMYKEVTIAVTSDRLCFNDHQCWRIDVIRRAS